MPAYGKMVKQNNDTMSAKSYQERQLAKELYLQGKNSCEIAELLGCLPVTIVKWSNDEHWAELRAAANISRTELRNKLLSITNAEVERYNKGQSDAAMGDTLVKLTAAVKNLDVGISIVDIIEVFTGFTKWLENTAQFDPRINLEFRKQVNTYMDAFIKFKTNE